MVKPGLWKGKLLRAACTAVAGAEAALPGSARLLLRQPRVQFLCFHDVPPGGLPGFGRLIEQLRRDHTLVSYGEGVRRIRAGRFDEPALAFSFDDGLYSQRAAARLLEQTAGVRACFFVCTSMLDRPPRDRVEDFCRRRLGIHRVRLLDWDDVAALREAGHEIGCHTASHSNLARCGAAELEDEIAGARAALNRRLGFTAEHFAWPYGRWIHFSPRLAQRVFDTGFGTCASAERGCHRVRPTDPRSLCVRRLVLDADLRPQDLLSRITLSALGAGGGRWPAAWTLEPGGSPCSR